MKLRINIIREKEFEFVTDKQIKAITQLALRNEVSKEYNYELSLVLCKNETMKEYNRNFRGKNYPTDVLSFPDGEKQGNYIYLGDIIISTDKVVEQAKEYGETEFEEFVRLFVHGILHLLGYDHETSKKDEEKMMDVQDRIIQMVLNEIDK